MTITARDQGYAEVKAEMATITCGESLGNMCMVVGGYGFSFYTYWILGKRTKIQNKHIWLEVRNV